MKNDSTRRDCRHCDGKGYVMDRGMQTFAALGTFGILPVLDFMFSSGDEKDGSLFAETCTKCKGKGWIRYEINS